MHTSASVRIARAVSRRARRLVPAGLVLVGVAGGASTEKVAPITIVTLRIVPQVDSFFNGKSTTGNPFAVTLFDGNSAEITDGRPIAYSSSEPDVFSVDSKTGVLTAKALGTGLFRATVSGRIVEAGVKIIAPVERVLLNTGDFELTIGNTRQLVPNLVSASGGSISNRTLNFSTSNPSIATVTVGGLVTAVAEGSATITVSVEGKSASVVVRVTREAVASIRLTPQIAQLMRVGGQLQVVATALNLNNQPLTGRTFNWSTNNPAVAVVSTTGVVTAVAVGNVTITAESETRAATLGITVTEVPPRSVALEPDTFQLGTNLTRQLTPVVIDSAGRLVVSLNNRQVIWQSTSSIVASVSTTGVVTGQGAGTARISVTVDGLRSNDVVVQVSPLVSSVVVTPFNPQVLRIGTTVQLTAQARDIANQPIPGKVANWLTNNPTIASVSTNGLVTGLAVGTTTITAEIDNRTAAVQITVTLVPVGSVTFTPGLDTLVVSDQKQYNPVVRDTAGTVIASLVGRTTSIVNTNTPIASATSVAAGVVISGSSQGTAVITLSLDGVASNPLTIRVAQVAQVLVTPSTATVAVGATQLLTVQLKDASGNVLISSRPITFSSNGPAFATVSPIGLVTGVATGTATITAQINGVIGTAVITVP